MELDNMSNNQKTLPPDQPMNAQVITIASNKQPYHLPRQTMHPTWCTRQPIPYHLCTQTGHIMVALPIPEMIHPAQQPQPEINLMQWLQSKLSTWEDPRWHQVTRHGPLHTLSNAITLRKTIIITSSKSVAPLGQGTCTWVLWSDTILWWGEHQSGQLRGLWFSYIRFDLLTLWSLHSAT